VKYLTSGNQPEQRPPPPIAPTNPPIDCAAAACRRLALWHFDSAESDRIKSGPG
jgi:hypothetical protein